MDQSEILKLLKQNVVPALGCTEPVCAALAAADAAIAAGGTVERIRLTVSGNIYKNSVSVGIAGFDRVGLDYAAALGALIRDTSAGLEIMKRITPGIAEDARALVDAGRVTVLVAEEERGVYACCEIESSEASGRSVIRGGHTNIVLTERDGKALYEADGAVGGRDAALLNRLTGLKVSEIRTLVDSLPAEELDFLLEGAKMNEALADYGIRENAGVGVSKALYGETAKKLIGEGVMERVMKRVAAAAEARLEGCPLATMSSAGSGSKGISVILPVIETANAMNASKEKTVRALAFAHLMNEYINFHVGKLSAICACATAAAPAASAAITYLMGGTDEEIGFALRNMTGSITGMICDGGKVGCSLKLATGMGAAFLSAVLALTHVSLRPTDGVCAVTPEDCIRNMGRISNPGMTATDREILHIMLEKSQKN